MGKSAQLRNAAARWLELNAPLRGTMLFLRRSDEGGAVHLLGRAFLVDTRWVHRREREKIALQGDVVANVQRLIRPYVARLRSQRLSADQAAYLNLIESNLAAIVSPFLKNAALRNRDLTRREVEIASLVRQGKSTKQITDPLHLSSRSVDFHRHNLRRKLGVGRTREKLGLGPSIARKLGGQTSPPITRRTAESRYASSSVPTNTISPRVPGSTDFQTSSVRAAARRGPRLNALEGKGSDAAAVRSSPCSAVLALSDADVVDHDLDAAGAC